MELYNHENFVVKDTWKEVIIGRLQFTDQIPYSFVVL